MLTLDGISAGYGTTTVLRDVHLTVPDSSVVALIGANGAGQEHAAAHRLGCAATVAAAASSSTARTSPAWPRTGSPPPGSATSPKATASSRRCRSGTTCCSSAGKGRSERRWTGRSTPSPTCGDRLAQPAGTMSGGQQQMLALARAYVSGAKVILLDEVSMGLAPIIVDQIFDFLDRLRAQGVSLLVVEQYVNKVLAIADYVYILGRGEMIFAGDAAELAGQDVFGHYLGIEATASTPQ